MFNSLTNKSMNQSSYCHNKGIEHCIDLFGRKPEFSWQNHIVK